jgi:hypothetical protein
MKTLLQTPPYKLQGLKILGHYSQVTKKVYKSKRTLKGQETKVYSEKLKDLQNKYNKY